MQIVPVYDDESSLWFAGTSNEMGSLSMAQRGPFFGWPAPDGSTKYGHAEGYVTRKKAEEACARLLAIPLGNLRSLCPWYWES